MELTIIILGIIIVFGYYYFKEFKNKGKITIDYGLNFDKQYFSGLKKRKKKDKLQDWKPHE